MKKPLTIRQIRLAFNIVVGIVLALFIGTAALLYLRYDNALSASPRIEGQKSLLSDFRSEDFQNALDRLEKRRDLPDPVEGARLPFGQIPD